jgi:protein O-GlcNAc transferase
VAEDAAEVLILRGDGSVSTEGEGTRDADLDAGFAEARARGPEALAELGVRLRALDRLEDAAACYAEATARAPGEPGLRAGFAAVLADLGAQAAQAGERDEGIRLYEKALSLCPTNAEALYDLGVAWMEEGCLERAALLFEWSFQVDPARAEAMNNLGLVHREITGPERAAECFLAAIRARPTFPEALNNLAVLHTAEGRSGDAAQLLEAALRERPDYPEAHNNLGVLQLDLGAVPDAIGSFERCLAHRPDDRHAFHNLLLAQCYVRPGDDPAAFALHRRWGERFSRLCPPLPALDPAEIERRAEDRTRPLVVGYLSPDLRAHSVAYFAEAPLLHHDPARVRVVVYSCTTRPDETTWRLRRAVEARGHLWHDVGPLPEHLLAQLVRDDEVDLLVELTGHMADNRLGVVARRPAPLQATWIGYPATTGLTAVDAFLTDARCVPPGTEQGFTEAPVRLPGCFLCYTPPPAPPDVAPSPAGRTGSVTFGSSSNLAKLTPAVLEAWARILQATPGARLAIKRKPLGSEDARRRLLDAFASLGVDPERVHLAPPTPTPHAHLAWYAEIDVTLDPWPYTGVTTVCESLLMGVPVVTLRGRGHAHNTAHSLLSAVGLDAAWSAQTADDYVAIATRAAADLPALTMLRAGLRSLLLASPLCDGPGFVRGLEETYRDRWERWRREVAGRSS